jgi:sugar phosphate permease
MATKDGDSEEAEEASSPNITAGVTSIEPCGETHAAYSIFTQNQKRGIVLLVAFAAVFSPLSSFIYYPARNALSNDLNVSLNKIDLTITSYMVVSGVAPTLVGGMADKLGRRPVYLVIFTIYVLANVGLAFQKSYPALLVLRMVQSAGSSGRRCSERHIPQY